MDATPIAGAGTEEELMAAADFVVDTTWVGSTAMRSEAVADGAAFPTELAKANAEARGGLGGQLLLCGFLLLLLGASSGRRLLGQSGKESPAAGSQREAGLGNPDVREAVRLVEHGDPNKGIAALERLSSSQPAVPGAKHALGVALYRTGKLMEAVKVLSEVEATDAQDVEAVQLHGLALYRLGQPAAAIPFLRRVRELLPNANADANYVLGLCYLNAHQYDDARASFAAQFGVPATSATAHLLLSRQLVIAQLPELAEGEARHALELDAHLGMAHFTIGEVALYRSQPLVALKEFEAEKEINPSYPVLYERLGDLYLRSGDLDRAQATVMKGLSLDTSSTGPFLLMGKILLRRGDPESALLYLKHAEHMDPNSVAAHTLLSQSYRSTGDETKAKAEADETARLNARNQLKLQPVE